MPDVKIRTRRETLDAVYTKVGEYDPGFNPVFYLSDESGRDLGSCKSEGDFIRTAEENPTATVWLSLRRDQPICGVKFYDTDQYEYLARSRD